MNAEYIKILAGKLAAALATQCAKPIKTEAETLQAVTILNDDDRQELAASGIETRVYINERGRIEAELVIRPQIESEEALQLAFRHLKAENLIGLASEKRQDAKKSESLANEYLAKAAELKACTIEDLNMEGVK